MTAHDACVWLVTLVGGYAVGMAARSGRVLDVVVVGGALATALALLLTGRA